MGLTSCQAGVTGGSQSVHDTSAVLNGQVYSTTAGTSRWWFEYGPTAALGQRSAVGAVEHRNPDTYQSVSATVTGLAEGTTYHYRTCSGQPTPSAAPICGAPNTFTTSSGRDSVAGFGVVAEGLVPGYVDGAAADASSAPDGTDITGDASKSPGAAYFRLADQGPVQCLRVEGNRATVGFTADYTWIGEGPALVPVVLYFEDNGATGDRVFGTYPGTPITTCPDPDTIPPTGRVITRGDIAVHDHPGP